MGLVDSFSVLSPVNEEESPEGAETDNLPGGYASKPLTTPVQIDPPEHGTFREINLLSNLVGRNRRQND